MIETQLRNSQKIDRLEAAAKLHTPHLNSLLRRLKGPHTSIVHILRGMHDQSTVGWDTQRFVCIFVLTSSSVRYLRALGLYNATESAASTEYNQINRLPALTSLLPTTQSFYQYLFLQRSSALLQLLAFSEFQPPSLSHMWSPMKDDSRESPGWSSWYHSHK